jgi:hypothetical protein
MMFLDFTMLFIYRIWEINPNVKVAPCGNRGPINDLSVKKINNRRKNND